MSTYKIIISKLPPARAACHQTPSQNVLISWFGVKYSTKFRIDGTKLSILQKISAKLWYQIRSKTWTWIGQYVTNLPNQNMLISRFGYKLEGSMALAFLKAFVNILGMGWVQNSETTAQNSKKWVQDYNIKTSTWGEGSTSPEPQLKWVNILIRGEV